MDAQEILVEHLREALRQLQRYLVTGLATALSLVLLALAPPSSTAAKAPLPVTIVPIAVDPSLVKNLLIAVFIASGFLCYSTVLDARKIAVQITDKVIRTAAASFPTVVSSADRGLRRLGSILSALIFVVFCSIDLHHAEARRFELYFPLLLFGVMPFVAVAYEVSQPFDAGSA